MVIALASHQCVPGSIPGPGVIYGLSLLLVLFLAPRGFSPGTPVLPYPQKPTFPNSNSFWDCQALYHEPLARIFAQALPVFEIKICILQTIKSRGRGETSKEAPAINPRQPRKHERPKHAALFKGPPIRKVLERGEGDGTFSLYDIFCSRLLPLTFAEEVDVELFRWWSPGDAFNVISAPP